MRAGWTPVSPDVVICPVCGRTFTPQTAHTKQVPNHLPPALEPKHAAGT
jgi:uncharacterized Zn finger protein (UPF0148 family)